MVLQRVLSSGVAASFLASSLLVGCSDETDESIPPADYGELQEAGIDQYLGAFTPSLTVANDDGSTGYEFEVADGPQCIRGTPFRFSTRDEPGSNDLMIFMQGGGACWSDLCLAIETAEFGIPNIGMMDDTVPNNPVAGWDIAYLPYCDGSLFAGDAEFDATEDSSARIQHGLQNLSAALDQIGDDFERPNRVLLAGASGGGYGTIMATVLVRLAFPDSELIVFNDSGIGLGQPGDPSFINGILEEFNIDRFIPESCEGCTDDGNITRFIEWQLEHDPSLRVGQFSFTNDAIIGGIFLELGEAFEPALYTATDELSTAFPARYHRYFAEGTKHTTSLGDPSAVIGADASAFLPLLGQYDETAQNGVPITSWVEALVDDSAAWVDVVPAE